MEKLAKCRTAAGLWLLLAGWTFAEQSVTRPETSLAVMRRTYVALDTDGDHRVSAAEAVAGGLDPGAFVAHDRDRDGHLDPDEFTMCYRDLLLKAGRPVPSDIADEVARVRLRIRQREDAERRRRNGDE